MSQESIPNSQEHKLPADIADMIEAGNEVRARGGQAYVDALREEREADAQGMPWAEPAATALRGVKPKIPGEVQKLIDQSRANNPKRLPNSARGATANYIQNRRDVLG